MRRLAIMGGMLAILAGAAIGCAGEERSGAAARSEAAVGAGSAAGSLLAVAPAAASGAAGAAGAVVPAAARAGEDAALRVEDAWVRAMPPVAEDTAAYLKVVNDGPEPVRLVGGATSVAGRVVPMITHRRVGAGGSMMGMEAVEHLEVPAGGSRVLEPGGDHLMLMGLKRVPQPGERVALRLRFEPGGREVAIEAPVVAR